MREEEIESWSFGDSPEMADELLALVLSGKKTATCGAVWDYEFHNGSLPKEDACEIILDGRGKPACKIRNTRVRIIPYKDVDSEFAAAEGEGDLSLADWRSMHASLFKRGLPEIGKEFSESMPLVCVNFEVLEVFD